MKENIQVCIDSAANPILLQRGQGQFAVFENIDPQSIAEYTRRNYYKIILTKVIRILTYGKQTITIDIRCKAHLRNSA